VNYGTWCTRFRSTRRKAGSRGAQARFSRRLRLEYLEDRRVLATFAVSNLLDAPVSGPGSAPGTLRQAIYDANNAQGDDVVKFDTGLSGTVNLSVVDDTVVGNSALLITSPITIRGNAAGVTIGRGGAAAEMRLFRVAATGSLTLDTISLTGGFARGASSSTPNEDGGNALGGAIYSQGIVSVVDSTLHGNQAIGGNAGPGGRGGGGYGGAVHNDHATLSVVNSTFSGNSVFSGTGATIAVSRGGAIATENGSTSIYNSTITNSTASTGRGLYVYALNGTATVAIQSTIIGQSDVSVQKREFLTAADVNGDIIVTGGNNLIRSQGDFQFITVSTDDPLLEPLANNGGPTMTHAITANSPALNSGNNSQNLAFDQRGASFARVAGGTADIGAYELQSAAGQALSGDYNGDHVVDGADFVVWRKTFGASVPKFSGADGDGSMFIDAGDYTVWRTGFGTTGAAAVGVAVAAVEAGNSPAATTPMAADGAITDAIIAIATVTIEKPIHTAPVVARGQLFRSSRTSDLALIAYLCETSSELRNSSLPVGGDSSYSSDSERQSLCEEGDVDAVWSAWPVMLDVL
jgi:hypothetical protein